jgi:hypothetical protein
MDRRYGPDGRFVAAADVVDAMKLADWFRPFERVVFIPDRSDYVARLHSAAPTVTPEEVAKLARKWKPCKPIDYDQGLPNG